MFKPQFVKDYLDTLDNNKGKESMDINSLCERSYRTARLKGWWDYERDIPHVLALVHSEVSEALEAYRSNKLETWKRESDSKPEGFAYELADILIRVADLSKHLDIDLEKAIEEKLNFNSTREYRHGNKTA